MMMGHFVKLMVFTMTAVARLLYVSFWVYRDVFDSRVLLEVSLASICTFYNSLFLLSDRIPNAGVPVSEYDSLN